MKKKQVPKLRFPEFTQNWKEITLGKKTSKVGSGITPKGGSQVYTDNGVLFIRSQNVDNNTLLLDDITFIPEEIHQKMDGSKVQPFDILLNITGASIGRSCVVPEKIEEANVNQHVCIIRLKENNEPRFFQSVLASEKGEKLIYEYQAGGGREGLNFANIRSFRFCVPDFEEQQKIADFLSSVDQKIQQLRRKKELLEEYKKGVMQKLFSQEVRFKDENGEDYPDWEYKELGDISDRITDKNEDEEYDFVLTNSAVQGVVSQTEYFDKSIANKSNLGGYYIVKMNDFVYNPRISSEAPVGPIKRNKLKTGVMSPLYSVFRINEKNLDFFEYFFETTLWHRYMHSVANFGARHDRMNITVGDFQKLPIPVPSEEEREKITDFINSVSEKLKTVNRKLDVAENFKKGLLQQMFV